MITQKMMEKIVNDTHRIGIQALNLIDDLKDYGLDDDADISALTAIMNKANGAYKLALYMHKLAKLTDEKE